jgi:hypothetical protein
MKNKSKQINFYLTHTLTSLETNKFMIITFLHSLWIHMTDQILTDILDQYV